MKLIIAGSRTVHPSDMVTRMVAREKPVYVVPMKAGKR